MSPQFEAEHPERCSAVERQLLELESVDVVGVHRSSARSASFGAWPDRLDQRLLAGLEQAGFSQPYKHQQAAVEALLDHRHVVIATRTASGKSLCFQVPILQGVLSAEHTRALMLFPTKALARDQIEGFRRLSTGMGVRLGLGLYDGDTAPQARRAARRSAHVVATNPDMLHRGILPNHEPWARFLAGLRYVIIDELHVYRGVFGSHVANVLRRLQRLCRDYGGSPTFIACSATIGNPRELAQRLCGAPFELVDQDGSPRGPRTTIVLNPKVIDDVTGVRRDYLKVTRGVSNVLRAAGLQTLVFCRTRKAVELLTRYMRDDEQAERDDGRAPERAAAAIRGYRGGYLPDRRRDVEAALRSGEARFVVTTNALELGIDIGGVDAVVLSGYPGTRAAVHQRAGRAGRRQGPSLAVLCLSSRPLDQFVASDPSFLWSVPVEQARIDPDNPEILLPHLRCAAAERVLREGDETLGGLAPDDLQAAIDVMVEEGALQEHRDGDIRVFASTALNPAQSVDLRGVLDENFAVVEESAFEDGDVIAQVDFEDAPLYIHPGAIYTVEGQTYEVRRLDWDERKAFVRRVAANYYTEAVCKLRVRLLDIEDALRVGVGLAHVVRSVPGFKKIRFTTHENIGFGPITLPDLELHTVAAFWAMPHAMTEHLACPVRRAGTALAVGHVLHFVSAWLLMCDVADLGHAVTSGHPSAWGAVLLANQRPSPDLVLAAGASPFVVLYDKAPGGTGLASAAVDRSAELLERGIATVSNCQCERGCPTCMGAGADEAWEVSRADVIAWLIAARQELQA